jgi:putative intracellular protease/amidase
MEALAMAKILIVVTSTQEYERVGYRTGLWLGELTHFWEVAEDAGFDMDIASPKGGSVPIDPESLLVSEIGEALGLQSAVLKRYENREFMDLLKNSLKIADVSHQSYDAIYLTGGHGVMFDYRDENLSKLIAAFYESGKIVSAVCHGPCGLIDVKLKNGEFLINSKNVTGFSWQEEVASKRDNAVPYNLEEEIKSKGAVYSKAALPFATHVIEDGNLITGQNPSSSHAVGEAVMRRLKVLTGVAS